MVVQSTSPLVARKSYWCVDNTLEAAGYQTRPITLYVPSFGEWGFVIGSLSPYQPPDHLPAGCASSTADHRSAMFQFPARHGACARPT